MPRQALSKKAPNVLGGAFLKYFIPPRLATPNRCEVVVVENLN